MGTVKLRFIAKEMSWTINVAVLNSWKTAQITKNCNTTIHSK